jgi:DNA-binding transcriptional LysR family regulator
MLNLWRLRLLRELASRHTMRAVAEALSMTTSGVSQQLAVLEREAGHPLLERVGRAVQLTDAGHVLARHAGLIFGAVEAAEAELAALGTEAIGTVRLTAFPSAAEALLPRVLPVLTRDHPQLTVHFRDLEPHESLLGLTTRQLDVAIVDDLELPATVADAGVEHRALLDDRIFAIVPRDHRVAGQDSATLADLAGEPWLLDDSRTSYHQLVLRAARSSGLRPKVVTETRNHQVALALVAAGYGVTLLPGLALVGSTSQVSARPLVPVLSRHISAAIRAGSSRQPTIAAVLQALAHAVEPDLQVIMNS